jgi:hypothetical protein
MEGVVNRRCPGKGREVESRRAVGRKVERRLLEDGYQIREVGGED